jgi:hypothetical protein
MRPRFPACLAAAMPFLPMAALATNEILLAVPSGQPVTLVDVLEDEAGPAGATLRFRFLAPEIGAAGSIDVDTAIADMAALCDSMAIPEVATRDPAPAQVVIALMDRLVPFGETDPDAVQYFEAYRIEDGACLWDPY